MGIRRTGVVALAAVLLMGAAPTAHAVSSPPGSRAGAPEITVDLTVATQQRTAVSVHYSVSAMPHNTRVVLERRDTPKGRYWPVDSAFGSSGELVDPDPVERPANYRVVLEGPRGFTLATKEAGHVG